MGGVWSLEWSLQHLTWFNYSDTVGQLTASPEEQFQKILSIKEETKGT